MPGANPSLPRRIVRRLLPAEQLARLGGVEIGLRARGRRDLDALGWFYKTDKCSFGHNYCVIYQSHLRARRRQVRSVLEIGVGGINWGEGYETTAGGQSLRMWRDFFPNAQVVGIDIHAKDIKGRRLHFERGDQGDPEFLRAVALRYGPFDLIIDDGSHLGRHIITSFNTLWASVKPGGLYAIEDLGYSYDPEWEGGPPGTPGTAADLLKGLIDATCCSATLSGPALAPEDFAPSIAGIHVYAELAMIERMSA